MELFELGTLKIKPEVELSEKDITFIMHFLKRHVAGDWGELANAQENNEGLVCEKPILSVYPYGDDAFIAVSTDEGRTTTTVYLPDAYIRDCQNR